MIEIKNVLIELVDKDMAYTNPLPVFYHFNQKRCIGTAVLCTKDDGLYADFSLTELPNSIFNHWPAIGYNDNGINQIGICTNANIDPRIMPMSW